MKNNFTSQPSASPSQTFLLVLAICAFAWINFSCSPHKRCRTHVCSSVHSDPTIQLQWALFACLDCLDKPEYVDIVAGRVSKPKNFSAQVLMNRPGGILPIAVTTASKAFCGRRNRVWDSGLVACLGKRCYMVRRQQSQEQTNSFSNHASSFLSLGWARGGQACLPPSQEVNTRYPRSLTASRSRR